MQPNQFTSVVKLAGCFAAIHEQPSGVRFISNQLESDLRVAQAADQLFATTHSIPYDGVVRTFEEPLLTVMKRGEQWFPTELHPDKVTALYQLHEINSHLSCVKSFAIKRS